METDDFPIGQILKSVSIVEYKQSGGDRLSLDRVQLFFEDTKIELLPIADTDEIEIVRETASDRGTEAPSWCQSFLGKKLMTVWVCENDRGYRDQVIFAFESLHPCLSFIAECSSLIVFRSQPIYRALSEPHLQHSQVS